MTFESMRVHITLLGQLFSVFGIKQKHQTKASNTSIKQKHQTQASNKGINDELESRVPPKPDRQNFLSDKKKTSINNAIERQTSELLNEVEV
jgi:hypothetical protein